MGAEIYYRAREYQDNMIFLLISNLVELRLLPVECFIVVVDMTEWVSVPLPFPRRKAPLKGTGVLYISPSDKHRPHEAENQELLLIVEMHL